MNVYDTANQLERKLRFLPEYITLKEVFTKIKKDCKAFELFEEFKNMQKNLEQKVTKGEVPNSEEQIKIEKIAKKINKNEILSAMFQKERAFGMIVEDVIKLVQAPMRDLYQ
ncbi:MAG: YlbF family regulator [Streptococcaceae bacterium]|jgi:cell fate (sporulation/competence/biofilm development) regulator YlbF (YheA/YmcA/DUF963 family)|nr:YlbF family regulator [Streptococcaceae bacterium]